MILMIVCFAAAYNGIEISVFLMSAAVVEALLEVYLILEAGL